MNSKDYEKMGGPFSPIYMADGTLEDSGITIRDWFAGQALPKLIFDDDEMLDPKKTAFRAYKFADAMIKEREK